MKKYNVFYSVSWAQPLWCQSHMCNFTTLGSKTQPHHVSLIPKIWFWWLVSQRWTWLQVVTWQWRIENVCRGSSRDKHLGVGSKTGIRNTTVGRHLAESSKMKKMQNSGCHHLSDELQLACCNICWNLFKKNLVLDCELTVDEKHFLYDNWKLGFLGDWKICLLLVKQNLHLKRFSFPFDDAVNYYKLFLRWLHHYGKFLLL